MRWFEAGVSTEAPPELSPGDILELRVFDDAGLEQGTILVGVWRNAASYKGGAVIEGRFLAASDVYYQWWMNEGATAPDRHRGWYHLCATPTRDCPETVKYKNMVHSDKYRNLGPKAPTAKRVAWLSDSILMAGCQDKFNKFRDGLNQQELRRVPMKSAPAEPEARWAGDKDDPGEDSPGESSSGDESGPDEGMRTKIAQLKEQLKKAEMEAMAKKKRKTGRKAPLEDVGKEKDRKEKKKDKRDPDRSGGERRNKRDGKDKAKKKKRSPSPSQSKKKRRRSSSTDKEKRKVKKKRRAENLEDSSGSDSSSPEALFTAKKDKGSAKDRGDKDRGPFGGGSPVEFGGPDTSDDDDQVFRKGSTTPAKSSQQRLLRYARSHPGRLASRLLLKMQEGTARGVVGPTEDQLAKTPVVALNYVLTILLPSLGQKAGVRSTRELKTLGTIMDHLAGGSPARAADVVGQRIKALERATQEGHWGAAQFLELLAPEGTMLLDRDEESFVTKEYLIDQKLKAYDKNPYRREGAPKGKGKESTGGKGKTKGRGAKDGGGWDKTAPKKDDAK